MIEFSCAEIKLNQITKKHAWHCSVKIMYYVLCSTSKSAHITRALGSNLTRLTYHRRGRWRKTNDKNICQIPVSGSCYGRDLVCYAVYFEGSNSPEEIRSLVSGLWYAMQFQPRSWWIRKRPDFLILYGFSNPGLSFSWQQSPSSRNKMYRSLHVMTH